MSIGMNSVHRSKWDYPFRYDVESQGPEEAGKANSEGIIPLDHNLSQSITRLHQTSQRHPETALKWDFEEDGPNRALLRLTENASILIELGRKMLYPHVIKFICSPSNSYLQDARDLYEEE